MRAKKTNIVFLTLVGIIVLALPVWAGNVALNKPITYDGTFVDGMDGRVVDGVFMPRSTPWSVGSLYWYGLSPNIIIDLQGTYKIDSMIVQADDNDSYRVEYWNGLAWQTAWDVPNYDAYGWGLQTRPNPDNDNEKYVLPAPITTNLLRFYATDGDGGYSVSEIQAFGEVVVVPLPGTLILLATGVSGLVAVRLGPRRSS